MYATISLFCVMLSISIQLAYTQKYVVPPALVEPLKPQGLRVSIPDSPGITLFAFHGNVNKGLMLEREAGELSVDVTFKENGRWTYSNQLLKLKTGDIIYYWLYVIKDGLGYERLLQSHCVSDFTDDLNATVAPCHKEVTNVEEKPPCIKKSICTKTVISRDVCCNELIFESTFETLENWTRSVYFSKIESEFVFFDNDVRNSFIRNGNLVIQPTLTNEKYGKDFITQNTLDLTNRCTSSEFRCAMTGFGLDILPPVMSAQLTTLNSFSFRYGKVEIKAKLPVGDWVVPELMLVPKTPHFVNLNSEKIKIATVFGNDDLRNSQNVDIGNKKLTSSIEVGDLSFEKVLDASPQRWTDDFHVFSLEWSQDEITTSVDNQKMEVWRLDRNGPIKYKDENGLNKPFESEFYLVLGVYVGGNIFPDGSINRGVEKPWENNKRHSVIQFYYDEKNLVSYMVRKDSSRSRLRQSMVFVKQCLWTMKRFNSKTNNV